MTDNSNQENKKERRERFKQSFFDSDRLIWKILSRFMDCVYLSTLWLVCSIPIITIGAATTALHNTAVHYFARHDDTILNRFFKTFKEELKRSILIWIVILIALALCAILWLYVISQGDSELVFISMISAFACSFVSLAAFCWAFPVLANYNMTGFAVLRAAVKISFNKIVYSFVMVIILIAVIAASVIFLFPVIFLPGLAAWADCLITENVFSSIAHE